MKKNVSGQYIYFSLVSALSGNAVTGSSGSISGRKSLDGLSGMIVLSGYIIELGGGSYRANLYDFDTNGDQGGYLFTASGCVPVQYQFDMIDGNASGAIWLASGLNVRVYSGQLSGQLVTPASGVFVTADLLSGRSVLVYSGQLSGQLVNLLSGNQVQVWSGTFVNVFSGSLSGQLVTAASGVNVVADVARWRNVVPNTLLASGRLDAAFSVRTNVAVSGTANTIQLDAGAPTGTSGIYDGQLITIVGGSGAGETRRIVFYSASGIATVAPSFTVAPFADSIFTITPGPNPTSGLTYIASGPFVQATATVASGLSVIATIYSGQLSGQPVTTFDINTATTSGKLQIASGPFVQATATVGSGVLYLASGSIFKETFASGVLGTSGGLPTAWGSSGAVTIGQNLDKSGYTAGLISGVNYIASGHYTIASLLSGQSVNVYSGQLSGNQVDANVTLWKAKIPKDLVASGHVNAFPSINAGQALSGTANTIQLFQPPTGTSGVLNGCIITIVEGLAKGQSRAIKYWGSSGIAVIDPAWDIVPGPGGSDFYVVTPSTLTTSGSPWVNAGVSSGISVIATIYSGQLSGQPVTTFDINTATTSGKLQIASGPFVQATATVASGLSVIATIYSGSLSGQPVTTFDINTATTSGKLQIASGPFVVASLLSGQSVNVYSGQLSGQLVTAASGLLNLASGSILSTTYASGVLNTLIPQNILTWNYSGAPNVSGQRNLLNATRKLMNRWSTQITSGYLTIYQEDDSTLAFEQAIGSLSGAAPIVSLDTR